MGATGWLSAPGARRMRRRDEEPPRPWHRWLARLAAAAAVAAVLAWAPRRIGGAGAAGTGERLRAELIRTRAASAELHAENLELRREIEALRTDPAAIEEIGRDDLGMVRPGDLVLRLIGGPPAAPPAADVPAEAP